MGFERRVKAHIPVDSPVMHWIVEHAAFVINRRLVGHDGKIPHRMVHQREAPPSQLEFGEQVLARLAPKRANAKRKLPLAPSSTQGTGVGVQEPIVENIIVLQFGRAVRTRTVSRRPIDDMWNLQDRFIIKVVPNNPNPGAPDEPIKILRLEEGDKGPSGENIAETPIAAKETVLRNFKFTRQFLERMATLRGVLAARQLDMVFPEEATQRIAA